MAEDWENDVLQSVLLNILLIYFDHFNILVLNNVLFLLLFTILSLFLLFVVVIGNILLRILILFNKVFVLAIFEYQVTEEHFLAESAQSLGDSSVPNV